MLPSEQITKRLGNNEIEIAPLAFMRGRTLTNAFVILDEAQNSTITQMKMFLTRLGDGSRMVITGDPAIPFSILLCPAARGSLREPEEMLLVRLSIHRPAPWQSVGSAWLDAVPVI